MASPARNRSDDDDAEPEVQGDPELEQGRMPFLSHLRELRDRVRNAALFFTGGFVVCFVFANDIYAWLREPLFTSWAAKNAELAASGKPPLGDPSMHFGSLTEPFWVNMSIALWAGVFVASPFIFHQIWKFIAPGLYKRERRITVLFSVCSAMLFTGGALFCFYFALPSIYDFLLGYADPENKPILMMQLYLDLTRDMMLAFGAVFELPILLSFLALVGLVTHRGLWKFNRWFVVIAFVVGAVLTPSPDVVSQVVMALPMIILYNVSILLAWGITGRREKAQARQREQERIADEEARAKRATQAPKAPKADADAADDHDAADD